MKKTELLKALEIVKPGLSSKDIIDQATSFAFIKGRVVTYNDEISISHPVPGLSISGAIRAEELYQLLKKLKQEEIDIAITGNEVILKSGKATAGLTLQQEITLPLEEITEKGKWHDLPDNFLKSIKASMSACTTEANKPILTCVHVNVEGFVEGSDGYRIVRYQLNGTLPVATFLIPAGSVKEVLKLSPTEIAESEGWIHFRTKEDSVISCRLFDDVFPDTASYLKVKGETLVFPKSMSDLIDRATVFAKGESEIDKEVSITLENNRIKLSSENGVGWFKEEANIRYDGEPITFLITPYLLKGILDETQECVFNDNALKFVGEDWEYMTALRG
jgi:DNA polymerase III sliding clamp (beta) subunit (PCNA family)